MLAKHIRTPNELFFWVLSAYFLNKALIALAQPVIRFIQVTWLINYDSGFTKRGLIGAVINYLNQFGPALTIIEIASNLILLILIGIYCSIIIRYRSDIYITLILILSPALIMFHLNDRGVHGRIEQLGMIITAINVFSIRGALKLQNHFCVSGNKHYVTFKTILTVIVPALMLSLLMFAHEATLLLSVPVNFILTLIFLFNIKTEKNYLNSFLYTALAYIPIGLRNGKT